MSNLKRKNNETIGKTTAKVKETRIHVLSQNTNTGSRYLNIIIYMYVSEFFQKVSVTYLRTQKSGFL